MQHITQSSNRYGSHSIKMLLCAASAASLAACLPESNKERRLSEFVTNQAGGYGSLLTSSATSQEQTLYASQAWLNGTMTQGLLGTSQNGAVAHAYCQEAETPINHMIISWLADTDNNGNFAVAGIGKEAGPAIIQAMAQTSSPQTIGIYDGGTINLRGPRTNNSTRLAIPSGCNLDIPEGAPILVAENLQAPDTSSLDTETYEYRTVSCEDASDVGVTTERRMVTADINGNVIGGEWEVYDSSCGGMQSVREVSISTAQGTIDGVAALSVAGGGDVKTELNKLSGEGATVKCAQVNTAEIVYDEEGNVVNQSGETISDTCITTDVDLESLEELGEAVVTDQIIDQKVETRLCGAGNTGSTNGGGSFNGYSGRWTRYGWNGTAVYIQNLYAAYVGDPGDSEGYTNTAQWGDWEGRDLSCSRQETLHFDCTQIFNPASYRDNAANTTSWQADGGMTLTRTNTIEGWQDPKAMTPNDPRGTTNWNAVPTPSVSASCSWYETHTFSSCPSGFSLIQSGVNRRLISARNSLGEFGQVNIGSWESVTALQCRKVESSTTPCDGGSSGGGGGGKVICTYFYQKGEMDEYVYYADIESGKTYNPIITRGYHFWGVWYARKLRENPGGWMEKIIRPIALHRAQEVAYQMGVVDKPDYIGKAIRIFLEPPSFIIGLFVKDTDWKTLYTGEDFKAFADGYRRYQSYKELRANLKQRDFADKVRQALYINLSMA